MNGRQVGVMWIGIFAIGALLLFPPYQMMPDMGAMLKHSFEGFLGSGSPQHVGALIKYGFLFSPPDGSVAIDGARQWPPIVFVALVTGALIATLARKPAGS